MIRVGASVGHVVSGALCVELEPHEGRSPRGLTVSLNLGPLGLRLFVGPWIGFGAEAEGRTPDLHAGAAVLLGIIEIGVTYRDCWLDGECSLEPLAAGPEGVSLVAGSVTCSCGHEWEAALLSVVDSDEPLACCRATARRLRDGPPLALREPR